MKLSRSILVTLAASLLPAFAQTSTCTTPPTALNALNIERTLTLNNLFSSSTPNIPTATMAAINAGALELREQMTLNTTSNVITAQGFTVAPGSPSPTPPAAINFSSVLFNYQALITNTFFTCRPRPAGLLVGTVINNSPDTPFGNLNGAVVAIGFGFTIENPPKINNVTVMIPGVSGAFSAAGAGTVSFPAGTVTPPGPGGAGPQIIFVQGQGPTMATAQRSILLDFSPSKDPNNLQLSFNIAQINPPSSDPQGTNAGVSISGGTTSRPTIAFNGIRGNYYFLITATNSQGGSSTQQVVIQYYGN